jgi:hypothetical protein
MLTDVQPSFSEGQTTIAMTALGRRTEDVDAFIEQLEGTGRFSGVLPKQHDQTEDGLARVLITATYRGTPNGASAPRAGASGGGQ